jgi:nicotinamidase-related amidase
MRMTETEEARSWLLCLNLNREYVTPGRPLHAAGAAAAAMRARACLSHARDLGWSVAHVQSRHSRLSRSARFARPIDGLEPLPSEALFITAGRSALAHPELRARLVSRRPSAIFLVGFALAHEGLASLFDAADLGLPLRIVEDAVASPAIGDRSAWEIDRAALAIAGSLSCIASSADLLQTSSGKIVSLLERDHVAR